MQLARQPLGGPVLALDAVHRLRDLVEAGGERARHALLEDQQLRHLDRQDLVAVQAAVGFIGRHRAQQRGPLVVVERAADVLHRGQQHVVLHVEDARGVVGALEEGAEAREVEGLAAHDGAVGDAAVEVAAVLHPVEELRRPGAGEVRLAHPLHLDPGGVERLPHLGGDLPAHRVRVLARQLQAAVDGGGVLRVEREEIHQRLEGDQLARLEVGLRAIGDGERREQVLLARFLGAEQHHVRGHAEDARHVLGALHLAAHPVNAVGDSREHQETVDPFRIGHSTTQVSLVPPPCEEFTTSEPSFSATRVRPPGTSFTSLPEST